MDSASRTLLEGQMSFHRYCHYFLADSSKIRQRKRSGNCTEFLSVRQNRGTGIDTLHNGVPGALPTFLYFSTVLEVFGTSEVHKYFYG
jgi:hypothetical protein